MGHWIFLGICKMGIVQPEVVMDLGFVEAHALKEEKKHDIHQIQELERSLSELKTEMGIISSEAKFLKPERSCIKRRIFSGGVGDWRESTGPYCLLHFSAEPPSSAPPAGTSEVEQLQDEAKHLRQEVESLEGKLQSQMENNQALRLLSKEQKERLQEQEERLRGQEERLRGQEERLRGQEERLWGQEERRLQEQERLCEQKERLRGQQKRLRDQGERLQKQEERLQKQEERLQKQEERLWEKEKRLRMQEERLALSQNHKFNKQLAKPQCSFEDLVRCPTWGACPHP
ncbi:uncharacterized protein [Chlorocebus sabaeus]|uniref:uncharacterized protein n=1 Tax=Chlorocebus sabaeus TaxID=60711 RepID=UPI003BF9B6B7